MERADIASYVDAITGSQTHQESGRKGRQGRQVWSPVRSCPGLIDRHDRDSVLGESTVLASVLWRCADSAMSGLCRCATRPRR